jgi:hypothetical protein
VPEVWFWLEEGFRLFRFGPGGYESVAGSGLTPGLDFDLLARYLRRDDQPLAVREFREAVRRPRP